MNEIKRLQHLAGVLNESAITINLPENTSYQEFAETVADYLKEYYGEHNFQPFLQALQTSLLTNSKQ